MNSQSGEQLLPDEPKAEETPGPGRSPILDPKNRSPLLPQLRRPAEAQPDRPETVDQQPVQRPAEGQPDRPETVDQQPAVRAEIAHDAVRQAGLELAGINDRLDLVEQKIEADEEFIAQNPEMVALQVKVDRLYSLLERVHHYDLGIAVAKSNWDHEYRRADQYQQAIEGRADIRAARDAAWEAFFRALDAPEGSPEKEALTREADRLDSRVDEELEAAIRASPGARRARERLDQAVSHHTNVEARSPRVREFNEQQYAILKEQSELERQIWADNPDRAEAHQALQAERSRLWDQQTEAEDRLDQAVKELESQPQPPESEDQNADLVSHR